MMPAAAREPVYKVGEIARDWQCQAGTIYGLISAGKLRAVRVGRLIRVPQSAVDDFLAGR